MYMYYLRFRLLQGNGYQFQSRGLIELRGFGLLETYFLLKNDLITDEDLIGPPVTQEMTYVNESKMDSPFSRNNKIHPLAEASFSVGVWDVSIA